MYWHAHLFFGLGVVSTFTTDPIVLALAGFLSILPDLDRPFGHRRWFSHSIFAAVLFAIVGFFASSLNALYAVTVFIAAGSHVFLDFFTKSGVPILHPWKKKHYGLRVVRSANRLVSKIIVVFGAFLLLFNLYAAYPL